MLYSAEYKDHNCPLFRRYRVLKFIDLVSLENCIFCNKCFNDDAFSLFSNHFKLTASGHFYCIRSVSNGFIFKRLYKTIRYVNKSIISSTVSTWNHANNLLNVSPKNMESLISKHFFENYEEYPLPFFLL